MTSIPEMPDDWWPDMTFVRAIIDVGDRTMKLQFAMTAEDAKYPELWKIKMNGLRFSLWQARHLEKAE